MISAHKHLDYALGFIGLNRLNDARDELALIRPEDRGTPEFLVVEIELAMARSAWARVITLAAKAIRAAPAIERPWIAWAYALREKQKITEAREVLLRAEKALADPGPLVDYNLACYYCLLGDLPEARRRLARACRREPDWKTEAAHDSDLAALIGA